MSRPDLKIASSLVSGLTSTMENMTFEEVVYLGKMPGGGRQFDIWASLPITSPLPGSISIELPLDYAKILAREVCAALQLDDPEAAINDAVGEILNTVAGRFLGELLGPEASFELGLPVCGMGKMRSAEEPVATIFFQVAGHTVRTQLFGQAFADSRTDIEGVCR